MRKILYVFSLALAMTLLASCNERLDCDCQVDEIVFGVEPMQAVATKAYEESTASSLQAGGFKVAGVTSAPSLMFNAVASFEGGVYKPAGGPFYFPSAGTMSFYAAYPASQAISWSAQGGATMAWTNNCDVDLLAAASENVQSGSSSVALSFDHILTLLKIKAVGTDQSVIYKVKSVKVQVPGSGTFTFGATPASPWSNLGSNVEVVYSSETTTLDPVTYPYNAEAHTGGTPIAGALTIIPCSPTVEVAWETYAADGTTLIASYGPMTRQLASPVTMGKTAVVTLLLPNADASTLGFSVTVTPWGEDENHELIFN